MFASLYLAVCGWLHAPPCGVPVDVTTETAPMPRLVPWVGIPSPVHPPTNVRPWKPPGEK